MAISAVAGLPLVEVKGFINGYIAPYKVIYKGVVRDVFGIKVDDYVYPVDVSPFRDVIIESIMKYDESFSSISCTGDDFEFDAEEYDLPGVGDESIAFGGGYYDDLWAYVYALSGVVESLGFPKNLYEFSNYSRFYPANFGGNYMVKLGSMVFLRVDEYDGGSVVSLHFSSKSPAVIYRSVWDVLVSGSTCEYFSPVRSLAEKISKKCNIEFFDVPVVNI